MKFLSNLTLFELGKVFLYSAASLSAAAATKFNDEEATSPREIFDLPSTKEICSFHQYGNTYRVASGHNHFDLSKST